MKWLVIQSAGEHEENKHLRECWALKHAIETLHYQCDVWGARHENFSTTPDFESYDVIFCAEQYEFYWLPDFTQIKKPIKIQWIVDLHVHRNYEKIQGFHLACHATKKLMSGYPCAKNLWFPNAVDDRIFDYSEIHKFVDIGFIGGISPERQEWMDRFTKDLDLTCAARTLIGTPMQRGIRSMRIHWNKSQSCDINYRNFETIGLGTCLLTNYDDDLLRLGFVDGENCLIYRDYQDALSKVQDALDDGRCTLSGCFIQGAGRPR
jgi:hypothetical protein